MLKEPIDISLEPTITFIALFQALKKVSVNSFLANQQGPDSELFYLEKWRCGQQRAKVMPWTAQTTGVGPLAWHCGDDLQFLKVEGKLSILLCLIN